MPLNVSLDAVPADMMDKYLRRLFALADTDGNGVLDKTEFAAVLKKSGFEFGPQKIIKVMRAADVNGDGMIQCEEFIPAMLRLLNKQPNADDPLLEKVGLEAASVVVARPVVGKHPEWRRGPALTDIPTDLLEKYLRKLFRVADVDNSGALDAKEFEQALRRSGFDFSSAQLVEIMEEADANHDGVIQYNEFVPAVLRLLGKEYVEPEPEPPMVALWEHQPEDSDDVAEARDEIKACEMDIEMLENHRLTSISPYMRIPDPDVVEECVEAISDPIEASKLVLRCTLRQLEGRLMALLGEPVLPEPTGVALKLLRLSSESSPTIPQCQRYTHRLIPNQKAEVWTMCSLVDPLQGGAEPGFKNKCAGKLMAAANAAGDVSLWRIKRTKFWNLEQGHENVSPGGELFERVSGMNTELYGAHRGPINTVMPVCEHTFATSAYDGTIRVWDTHACLSNDMDIAMEHSQRIVAHKYPVAAMCVVCSDCPEEDTFIVTFASISQDNTVKLWRSTTTVTEDQVSTHTEAVCTLLLCASGGHSSRQLVSCLCGVGGVGFITGSEDASCRKWSVTGKCEQVFLGHKQAVSAVMSHDTLPVLISGSWDHTVRTWCTQSGHCLAVMEQHTAKICRLSDMMGLVASCSSDGTIRFWNLSDPSNPDCVHKFKGCGEPLAMCYVGDVLCSAYDSKAVRVWG